MKWMADNKHTLANPTTARSTTGFEIYNPGTNAVDLGGYYLTGTLSNKTKFRVPSTANTSSPPAAISWSGPTTTTRKTAPNSPELHVKLCLEQDRGFAWSVRRRRHGD